MNRLEDRLRDALGAAADTVRPESVARLPDPSRGTRMRHFSALAAAAAVAVVIIGASVITPFLLAGGHAAPARPAGPAATSPAAPASPSTAAGLIVPDVVGMQAEQATAILDHAGLHVTVVARGRGVHVHCSFSGAGQLCDSTVAAGTVISQAPAAGTRVPTGASILVLVAVTGSSPTPAQGATG